MSSLTSPTISSIVLLSISATLYVALFSLPLFLAPSLFTSSRSSTRSKTIESLVVGLAVSSTFALVLHGICSLTATGRSSIDGSVAGGIWATLGLIAIDVQSIAAVLWLDKTENKSLRKSPAWTSILAFLLLLVTIFQVVLLAIDEFSRHMQLALTHARGVFHLAFDLILVYLLVIRAKKSVRQANRAEKGTATTTQLDSSLESQIEERQTSLLSKSRLLRLISLRETRLVALQLLSALLSILSISLPKRSNWLSLVASTFVFTSPTIFGSTTSPVGFVVIALFATIRWSGNLFELAAMRKESIFDANTPGGNRSSRHESRLARKGDIESSTPSQLFSPIPSSVEGMVELEPQTTTVSQAPATSGSTAERPSTSRSRHHSLSSSLSYGANVPPPISEEGERSKEGESSGSTDHHEAYLHSETLPVPFTDDEATSTIVTTAMSNRVSHSPPPASARRRSASSPEPYHRSLPPRTPSPIAARTRKDAGRLSRGNVQIEASTSTTSLSPKVSPTRSRPQLKLSVDAEDTFHTAASSTPPRRPHIDSRSSTPSHSPVRTKASLRSLAGFSPPRPGDSPTSVRSRRWSRSSSMSFLRGGQAADEGGPPPAMEIETDEEDPFAPGRASHVIEAAKKVEEWEKRKRETVVRPRDLASEISAAESSDGYEEDIEIVSPTRYQFEHLSSPVKLTSSSLRHITDPTLHPRRSSSSNSLFQEHFDDSQDLDLPAHLRKKHSPTLSRRTTDEVRSRSSSLGSAFSFNETVALPIQSTPRNLFGTPFANPSLSPTLSASAKLRGVIGVRSNPSRPPRADSPVRPLSSEVMEARSISQRVQRSGRSSAPPPASSPSSSPKSTRTSPIRRFFPPARSPTIGRRFASSPAVSTAPAPAETRLPKSSRASSTVSINSFRLSNLRRRSTTGMLRASLRGTSEFASTRQSVSSDLSFACRGEIESSKGSSGRRSHARSASLDFHPDTSTLGKTSRRGDETEVVDRQTEPSSPTLTGNWWNQPSINLRSTTPYRPSPRRRHRLTRSSSAPALSGSINEFGEIHSGDDEIQVRPRKGHTRSRSLPLNRLSAYQLAAPARVSPIGSLILSIDDDITPKRHPASISLAEPFVQSLTVEVSSTGETGGGHGHQRSISEGDVDELTKLYETFTPYDTSGAPSRASLDGAELVVNHEGDEEETARIPHQPVVNRLTASSSLSLGSGFEFVDRTLTPVPSTASFSPSTNASISFSASSNDRAFTPTSPTSTFLSSNTPASLPPSPSHSMRTSSSFEMSRISTESTRGAHSIDYWLHRRSSWVEGEEECLEGTGESEQMI